jgi:hypothetical protein
MLSSVSFLRVDVLQFRASNDPPNGGSRGAPKGDVEESPVTGRATANRGPNAAGKHPQTIAATVLPCDGDDQYIFSSSRQASLKALISTRLE